MWLGEGWGPPRLRPQFSVRKGWIAMGVNCCPKQRGSSISSMRAWDGQPVWFCVSCNVGIVLDHWDEEGIEQEGRLLVYLLVCVLDSHLWQWALSSDRTKEIMDTSLFSGGWQGSAKPLRWDWVKSLVCRSELGVKPLPVHIKRSLLRFGGLPGIPNQNEVLWQTQNPLEGLCIPSGKGTPQDLPGEAKKCCQGEGFWNTLFSLSQPQKVGTSPTQDGFSEH